MTEDLNQLIMLASAYGQDNYDAEVVVTCEEPLRIATRDEDFEGEFLGESELRAEPDYCGRMMYSLLPVNAPEGQRVYFSGSGAALFALLWS